MLPTAFFLLVLCTYFCPRLIGSMKPQQLLCGQTWLFDQLSSKQLLVNERLWNSVAGNESVQATCAIRLQAKKNDQKMLILKTEFNKSIYLNSQRGRPTCANPIRETYYADSLASQLTIHGICLSYFHPELIRATNDTALKPHVDKHARNSFFSFLSIQPVKSIVIKPTLTNPLITQNQSLNNQTDSIHLQKISFTNKFQLVPDFNLTVTLLNQCSNTSINSKINRTHCIKCYSPIDKSSAFDIILSRNLISSVILNFTIYASNCKPKIFYNHEMLVSSICHQSKRSAQFLRTTDQNLVLTKQDDLQQNAKDSNIMNQSDQVRHNYSAYLNSQPSNGKVHRNFSSQLNSDPIFDIENELKSNMLNAFQIIRTFQFNYDEKKNVNTFFENKIDNQSFPLGYSSSSVYLLKKQNNQTVNLNEKLSIVMPATKKTHLVDYCVQINTMKNGLDLNVKRTKNLNLIFDPPALPLLLMESCISRKAIYFNLCYALIRQNVNKEQATSICTQLNSKSKLAKISDFQKLRFIKQVIKREMDQLQLNATEIGIWIDHEQLPFYQNENLNESKTLNMKENKTNSNESSAESLCVELRNGPNVQGGQNSFYWNETPCTQRNMFLCETPMVQEEEHEDDCDEHVILEGSHPSHNVHFNEKQLNKSLACVYEFETPLKHMQLELRFAAFRLGTDENRCKPDEHVEVRIEQQKLKRELCGDWTDKVKLLRFVSKRIQLRIRSRAESRAGSRAESRAGSRAESRTGNRLWARVSLLPVRRPDWQAGCDSLHWRQFEQRCYLPSAHGPMGIRTAQAVCSASNASLVSERLVRHWDQPGWSRFALQVLADLGGQLPQRFWLSESRSGVRPGCTVFSLSGNLTVQVRPWPCDRTALLLCVKDASGSFAPHQHSFTLNGPLAGYLTSAGYPQPYSDSIQQLVRLNCEDDRSAYLLTFSHLDIEPQTRCLYDYLQIYTGDRQTDVRLCGEFVDPAQLNNFTLVSAFGQDLFIRFHSDHTVNGQGFRLKYQQVKLGWCQSSRIVRLNLTDSVSHTFTSPGYPHASVPGLDCQIDMQATRPRSYIIVNINYLKIAQNCSQSKRNLFKLVLSHTGQQISLCDLEDQSRLVTSRIYITYGSRLKVIYQTKQRKFGEPFDTSLGFQITVKTQTQEERLKSFVILDHASYKLEPLPNDNTGRNSPDKSEKYETFNSKKPNEIDSIEFDEQNKNAFFLATVNFPLPVPSALHGIIYMRAPVGYRIQLSSVSKVKFVAGVDNCPENSLSTGIQIEDRFHNLSFRPAVPCVWTICKEVEQDLSQIERNPATLSDTDFAKNDSQIEHITITSNLHVMALIFKPFTSTVAMQYSLSKDANLLNKTQHLSSKYPLDSCFYEPCGSNGNCTLDDLEPLCKCANGFSGLFCHLRPCDLKPCSGNGQCRHTENGENFVCHCYSGFTGRHCTNTVAGCERNNPCAERGRCSLLNGLPVCHCYAWYEGRYCEKLKIRIHYKPLSQRMLEEPFWLGLITVFVVLVIICLVYLLKKKFAERIERFFAEEIERSKVHTAFAGENSAQSNSGQRYSLTSNLAIPFGITAHSPCLLRSRSSIISKMHLKSLKRNQGETSVLMGHLSDGELPHVNKRPQDGYFSDTEFTNRKRFPALLFFSQKIVQNTAPLGHNGEIDLTLPIKQANPPPRRYSFQDFIRLGKKKKNENTGENLQNAQMYAHSAADYNTDTSEQQFSPQCSRSFHFANDSAHNHNLWNAGHSTVMAPHFHVITENSQEEQENLYKFPSLPSSFHSQQGSNRPALSSLAKLSFQSDDSSSGSNISENRNQLNLSNLRSQSATVIPNAGNSLASRSPMYSTLSISLKKESNAKRKPALAKLPKCYSLNLHGLRSSNDSAFLDCAQQRSYYQHRHSQSEEADGYAYYSRMKNVNVQDAKNKSLISFNSDLPVPSIIINSNNLLHESSKNLNDHTSSKINLSLAKNTARHQQHHCKSYAQQPTQSQMLMNQHLNEKSKHYLKLPLIPMRKSNSEQRRSNSTLRNSLRKSNSTGNTVNNSSNTLKVEQITDKRNRLIAMRKHSAYILESPDEYTTNYKETPVRSASWTPPGHEHVTSQFNSKRQKKIKYRSKSNVEHQATFDCQLPSNFPDSTFYYNSDRRGSLLRAFSFNESLICNKTTPNYLYRYTSQKKASSNKLKTAKICHTSSSGSSSSDINTNNKLLQNSYLNKKKRHSSNKNSKNLTASICRSNSEACSSNKSRKFSKKKVSNNFRHFKADQNLSLSDTALFINQHSNDSKILKPCLCNKDSHKFEFLDITNISPTEISNLAKCLPDTYSHFLH